MATNLEKFYKFKLEQKTIHPEESFTIHVKTAMCGFCKDQLIGGLNYTPREGMPLMCDKCFKEFGDKAMDMANGG